MWCKADNLSCLGNFFRINVPQDFSVKLSDEHTEYVWNTVEDQIDKFPEEDMGY